MSNHLQRTLKKKTIGSINQLTHRALWKHPPNILPLLWEHVVSLLSGGVSDQRTERSPCKLNILQRIQRNVEGGDSSERLPIPEEVLEEP